MTRRPDIPYWPRGLSDEQAARYVGVCENTFKAERDAGLWPKPERRGRRVINDRHRLDEAWDQRQATGSAGDPLMEALSDSQA